MMLKIFEIANKNLFPEQVAIDATESTTLIGGFKRGLVFRADSAATFSKLTGELVSSSTVALNSVGRSPSGVVFVSPFQRNVISSATQATAFLNYCLFKGGFVLSPIARKPSLVFTYDPMITSMQLAHWKKIFKTSGFGALKPVARPLVFGNLLKNQKLVSSYLYIELNFFDTRIYLVSAGELYLSKKIGVGLNQIIEVARKYLIEASSLSVGYLDLRLLISQLSKTTSGHFIVVRGKSLEDGLPRSVRVESKKIYELVTPLFDQIVEGVLALTKVTNGQICSDLSKNPFFLNTDQAFASIVSNYVSKKTDYNNYPLVGSESLIIKSIFSLSLKNRVGY